MRTLFKTSSIFKSKSNYRKRKTIHSEGSCVLTSVFCGLSPSLTTKHFESWQVWVPLVTVLFTLSKPELKNHIGWRRRQQRVAGLRTQYSFPGWWRVSTYGSKTKRGKSETLFQPYLMASGQSKEVCRVLGGDGAKGSWGGGRKKQHPSIKVGEKIWGKPWIPHQRPISEGSRGGYNLCFGQGWSREVEEGWWLGGREGII